MAKRFDEAELKKQIAAVIKYSQHYTFDVNVDDLFNNWLIAKDKIVDALGGNLIYEYPTPVTFTLNQSHKNTLLGSFIEAIIGVYHNAPLATFVEMNKSGFFDNRVVHTDDEKNIPIGMKLIKAFKNFVNDKDALYELQSRASQIIQEEKLSGTLCISVHPLDFLSSSENNHNWRSCHALDGEYRCGNLSYMQDSATMLVYIKSNNELSKLPNFPEEVPWNSKKWRMLLYMSDGWDMMMAGRQYPFAIQGALDFISNKLLPQTLLTSSIVGKWWTGWSNTFIESIPITIDDEGNTIEYRMRKRLMPGGAILRPIDDIVVDCDDPLHFNDLLYSSCYVPYYRYRKYFDGMMVRRYPKLFIGHEVKCVHCGKERVSMSSTFLCDSCDLEYGMEDNDLYATCECCGHRFFADDGVWVEDDNYFICPSCAETETIVCEQCGGLFFKNSVEYSHGEYICHECAEDRSE